MEPNVETGLRLPSSVHRDAEAIARQEERSLNAQIVKWVKEGIARAKKEAEE